MERGALFRKVPQSADDALGAAPRLVAEIDAAGRTLRYRAGRTAAARRDQIAEVVVTAAETLSPAAHLVPA